MQSNLSKTLLATYFENHPYPCTNIQSYDKFLYTLDALFDKHAKRSWKYEGLSFEISLRKPKVQPSALRPDAALRLRTSYTTPITAELCITREEKVVYSDVVIVCEVPAMVRPTEHDMGCYFIINGTERVVITQEVLCNMPHIVNYSKTCNEYYIVSGRSSVKLSRKGNGSVYVTQLGFNPLQKNHTLCKSSSSIRIATLFMALGVETVEDAIAHCTLDNSSQKLSREIKMLLLKSWSDLPEKITSKKHALKHIASLIGCKERGGAAIEYVITQLHWACFPYFRDCHTKIMSLALMFYKLVRCSIGERQTHDVFHIGRKRYDRVGNMLTKMMRASLRSLLSGSSKRVDAAERKGWFQEKNGARYTFLNADYITNTFCSSLGTGNILNYEGISQVFNRMNTSSQLSHLCCIQRQILKQAEKMTKPRSFHLQSSAGFIDPHHTPEGSKCGTIIYPTILSIFSVSRDSVSVWQTIEHILKDKLQSIEQSTFPSVHPLIYLNGVWKGTLLQSVHDVEFLLSLLRAAKFSEQLPFDVSIYYDTLDNEVHIWCDENRILRPLVRLPIPPNIQSLCWETLMHEGYIEYVSPFEAEKLIIAEDWNHIKAVHTHCEIGGLAVMSYSSCKIPYGGSNPSCRTTYYDAQGKQAIPTRTTAICGDHHQLWYGQKPLASSCIDEVMSKQQNTMLEGVNVTVAVLCYGGFNQEDAIIFNQSSIDRGLFRSFFFKYYYMEEDDKGNTRICRCDNENSSYSEEENYGDTSALEMDGLPMTNTHIKEGQAVIGVRMNRNGRVRNSSVIAKKRGVVQETTLMQVPRADATGRKKVNVRAASVCVRSARIPIIGDKFSSSHGQKGTIGMVYRQEDMPFTADGMVPDIIINPHAFPTRMTVSQPIEALSALVTCLTGKFFDASPLQSEMGRGVARETFIREYLCEELKKRGMHPMGDVAMIHGMTGELMQHLVFMAPVYYSRLKHMIEDKEYTRARGPVNSTTRQPTEGRSKGGGLRFGEMERDSSIGSGCASFINDRLSKNSDAYATPICKSCGIFGVVRTPNGFRCRDSRCVGNTIVKVLVPYSLILFFKELLCMNITPRIRVKQASIAQCV